MEDLLDYLARFGNPHLWRMRDGDWVCRMEMFVTGPGLSFEVKCLDGKTPMDALQRCKERMDAALTQLAPACPTLKEPGDA